MYEGIDVQTGGLVALKRLRRTGGTSGHEAAILRRLSHPNVVRPWAFECVVPEGGACWF